MVRTQDLKKMRSVLEKTKPANGCIHPFAQLQAQLREQCGDMLDEHGLLNVRKFDLSSDPAKVVTFAEKLNGKIKFYVHSWLYSREKSRATEKTETPCKEALTNNAMTRPCVTEAKLMIEPPCNKSTSKERDDWVRPSASTDSPSIAEFAPFNAQGLSRRRQTSL